MNSPLIYSSLTRISPLAEQKFTVDVLPKEQWGTGDYVACEVRPSRDAYRDVELANGRMREAAPEDRLIGALGGKDECGARARPPAQEGRPSRQSRTTFARPCSVPPIRTRWWA